MYAVARNSKSQIKIISGKLNSLDDARIVLARKAAGAFVVEYTSANPRSKRGNGVRYSDASTAIKRVSA